MNKVNSIVGITGGDFASGQLRSYMVYQHRFQMIRIRSLENSSRLLCGSTDQPKWISLCCDGNGKPRWRWLFGLLLQGWRWMCRYPIDCRSSQEWSMNKFLNCDIFRCLKWENVWMFPIPFSLPLPVPTFGKDRLMRMSLESPTTLLSYTLVYTFVWESLNQLGYYLKLSEEDKEKMLSGFSEETLKEWNRASKICEDVHRRNKHKLNGPTNLNIMS